MTNCDSNACRKYFHLLLIASIASMVVYGLPSYTIEFLSFRYEIYPSYFKSFNLGLVNYSKHMALDGCFVFSKDIHSFKIQFEFSIPKVGVKPWVFLNTTMDACKALANSNGMSRKFISMFTTSVLAVNPKFPQKCPLEMNKVYCFTNFTMDSLKLPAFLPEGKINFQYSLIEGKLTFYTAYYELYGSIKK